MVAVHGLVSHGEWELARLISGWSVINRTSSVLVLQPEFSFLGLKRTSVCFPYLGCTTADAESLLPIRIGVISASITISMSCASSDSTLPMLCVASIQIFFQIGKKKTLFMLKRLPSKYDVSINLWPWELL
jgi:hypothetical protein